MINENKIHGAIAILDILGFSSRMEKLDIDKIRDLIIGETITNCIVSMDYCQHEYQWDKNAPKLNWLFFADSLIIYLPISKDSILNTPQILIESLSLCCGILLASCFYKNISLRGAISYGEFLISNDPLYVIGKPLSEARELETIQEWAGVSITENASKLIDDLEATKPFIVDSLVPLKDSKQKNMFCVNWPLFIAGAYNDVSVGLNRPLPDWELCFDSKSNSVNLKKENTIYFFYANKLSGSPPVLIDNNLSKNIGNWYDFYRIHKHKINSI